jgi:hypothetical protein
MEMSHTSWATIVRIFQDMIIILGVELMILNKINPGFYEEVEETINEYFQEEK